MDPLMLLGVLAIVIGIVGVVVLIKGGNGDRKGGDMPKKRSQTDGRRTVPGMAPKLDKASVNSANKELAV
jgi:hypothetical protein